MLKKTKDGEYTINLDEYADVGTYWIAFISIVLVLNMFLKKLKNYSGITNIFRVQANNSVMRSYFCTGFIDFMLAGKNLTDFKSIFSPYDFKRNDNIILSYFKDE